MNLNIKNALLVFLVLSAALSAGQLTARTIHQGRNSARAPLHSLAAQFEGLRGAFANVRRAGYYTDKNPELPLVIAQFEQAQYILAPSVLELNNTSLPLIIFDCTSPAVALAKIQELGLTPVSASNTGLILAVNPKATP